MKEGLIIAKKEPRVLNPIQFNVLAIILVLGLLPFAVALVSNAGSSSNERYMTTMPTTSGLIGEYYTDTYWLDNGGDNYTQYYFDQEIAHTGNPAFPIDSRYDCAYVVDGFCKGYQSTDPPRQNIPPSYYAWQFYLPTVSTEFTQSHHYVSRESGYSGASGDDVYSWHLESKFFEEIEQHSGIDGLRFWMVDEDILSCNNYAGYTDINFEGKISFHFDNQTRTFEDYQFKKSNKFEYSDFDYTHGGFVTSCSIGFIVDFDFSNFESLSIDQFNGGDWDNTSISLYLENFEREDGSNFADTPLPFAGDGFFYLGIEHKKINPTEVGFFVKTGTLVLSFIVLGVGLASTPYWDPFRNFFKGALE